MLTHKDEKQRETDWARKYWGQGGHCPKINGYRMSIVDVSLRSCLC